MLSKILRLEKGKACDLRVQETISTLAIIALLSLLLASCSTLDRENPDQMRDVNWGGVSSSSAEQLSSSLSESSLIFTSSSVDISSSSLVASSSSSAPRPKAPTCTYDATKNILNCPEALYGTTTIDGRTWMSENMKYATDSGSTADSTSWCYEGLPANCTTYGRLYNWSAAKQVCPVGWHLPDTLDFRSLYNIAVATNTHNVVGAFTGEVRSTTWATAMGGWPPTDSHNFHALPAGARLKDGSFATEGSVAVFWLSEDSGTNAYRIFLSESSLEYTTTDKEKGASVRCIKNP